MKKDNEYKEKSAKRLRYALELKEMKQQDLADKSGVSKNSISQYLSQRSVPSNLSAGKMAQVLQVDPMWLMGYDVPMIKGNSDSSTKFDNIFPIEIHKFPLLGGSSMWGTNIHVRGKRELWHEWYGNQSRFLPARKRRFHD